MVVDVAGLLDVLRRWTTSKRPSRFYVSGNNLQYRGGKLPDQLDRVRDGNQPRCDPPSLYLHSSACRPSSTDRQSTAQSEGIGRGIPYLKLGETLARWAA